MSVLIKGMEMPKNCTECEQFRWSNIYQVTVCTINERIKGLEKSILKDDEGNECRPSWCPFVEVPTPHGRLIDENWLFSFISVNNSLGATHYGCLTKEEIQLAPTVIEREE